MRSSLQGSSVEVLARYLIQAARSVPVRPQHGANDASQVLFDLEADGIRCVVLRSLPSETARRHALSPRESEIARMVAKGLCNKSIAAVLEISPWTVCTHLRRIFTKLDVRSRAAMVASVLEARIGTHEPPDAAPVQEKVRKPEMPNGRGTVQVRSRIPAGRG